MPETIKVGDLVTWNYPTGHNGLYGYKYRVDIDKQGKRVMIGREPKDGWGEGPFKVTQVIEVAEVARKLPFVSGHHRRGRTRVEYGKVGHPQWVRIECVNGETPKDGTFSGRLFRRGDPPGPG